MLELRDVAAGYDGVSVVEKADLFVGEGEIVALVGSNGGGKTTLMRAISGLLPLLTGSICFDGVAIDTLPAHQAVDLGIAHVPEGRLLFRDMTVLENLKVGGSNQRARGSRDRLLEEVWSLFPRLKDRQNQRAATLSGGEQQMVAIGRGIMASPRLMILDEPSLGLSPLVVRQVFSVIKGLREERGFTILLSEQNVRQSLAISDRAYVIENGRIINTGTSTEILEDEHTKQAYLGI